MFNVVLANGLEELALTFKVRNTSIAERWFNELSQNYEILEDHRLSNWGEHNYIDDLNYHIGIINQYDNIINCTVSPSSTQKEFNYLHTFFENLRGEVVTGTPWYNSAPEHVKNSVCEFNVLIHKLESFVRTQTKHPTIVVTFKNRPRFELNQSDIDYFTCKWQRGAVYINYCQVGKTVLDVFKDNDDVGTVRPQTHYSADFLIKFGPSTNYFSFILRKLIINIWLIFQKFKFKNPNIGYIPVADIIKDFNIEDYRKFNKVKSVICLK
jgi:hypothetical protein